jgi:hypothetical protein
MALRVTKEMLTEMDNLGYEKMIKEAIGFNFESIYKEHCNIEELNHDKLNRHMTRINNDMIRFDNQLCRKVNEDLYFFNNCNNMQKYVNELRKYTEPSDLKFLRRYFISHYKDLLEYCALKHEELKSEAMEKNKKHMKEHASEEITCECGATICRRHISRHKLTKKHLDNMPIKEVV